MPSIEELMGCDAGASTAGGRAESGEEAGLDDIVRKRKLALEAIKSGMVVRARVTAVEDYGITAVLERVSGGLSEGAARRRAVRGLPPPPLRLFRPTARKSLTRVPSLLVSRSQA